MNSSLGWILNSSEPWTRYRTLVDLLDQPESAADVESLRKELLDHAQVQELVVGAASWPGYPLKRHNDAKHPIYQISTIADFGLRAGDPGIEEIFTAISDHRSPEGAFQSLVHIPKTFGGSGEDQWAWILCDSPTLLHSLLRMGYASEYSVVKAVDHLLGLIHDNGWRCTASPELGKFKGPGRKIDPCPIANVYALKAISQMPALLNSAAAYIGTEVILGHWQNRKEKKYYLFAMGSDFSKLKYPFIWYDILHVVDVLSRFPIVHSDPRFKEMVAAITGQADADGRFTAGSMYRAWKGWSFANKKEPSPWLTFLVLRILKRLGQPI